MSTDELAVWVAKNSPSPDDAARTAVFKKIAAFAAKLDLESTIDDGEIDPTVFEIMAGILGADTEDAIFAAANKGTIATKTYLDQPFLLKRADIQFKLSGRRFTEEGGFPYYALLRVTDLATGEIVTLNGGGKSFLTTIWALQKSNSFERYEETGGMPMVLIGKIASSGNIVVIPKKYILPTIIRQPSAAPTDDTATV